jgi:hypothetical protein
MKTSLTLLFSLVCAFSYSQSSFPYYAEKGLGFQLLLNMTPAQTFSRNYPQGLGADQTSRPRLGYEGRLVFTRFFNEKLSADFGVLTGAYPIDLGYFASKEFTGGTYDTDYRDFLVSDYGLYTGLHSGLQYQFGWGTRSHLAAGAGLSWVWFTPLTDVTTSSKYYTAAINTHAAKPFLAPEASLRFSQLVGRQWLLHLGVQGTYTKARPIRAEYTITGQNETLTGVFEKQYAHLGLSTGVAFLMNSQLPELQRPERQKSEYTNRQSLSLSVQINRTPRLSIARNYPAGSGADLSSPMQPGVEGRLQYNRLINDRLGIYAGLSGGSYPANYNLSVTEDFLPDYPAFNDALYVNSAGYIGLNFGGRYYFQSEERLYYSVGAGIGLVYFPPVDSYLAGYSIFDGQEWFEVLTENAVINPNREIIVAPEVSFQVYQRLGRQFVAFAGVSGSYSFQKPIVAKEFVFHGTTELTGSYEKRFANLGIEAGVAMLLEKIR